MSRGIPVGGDCRKAIQPVPLDIWPTEDTCRVVGKAVPFPPAQRRVAKFRRGAGCPFQRAALLGEATAVAGGKAPTPPRESPRRFAARRDESVIVGYYTSRRKCIPRTPSAFNNPKSKTGGFLPMARGDGIDRTNARNMRLTATKIGNTQQHNEREKDSYVNQDIVLERTPLNVHFKTPSAGYQEMFAQMEADGVISTRGIKEDAFRYGELVFDVNSAYFYNHSGYDFAKQFYTEAYKAAIKIVGGEQYILSAVMHADERNRAMSEALGEDVYHYHLHVVYIPVVEKEIRWTKRCKDKSLVGKVKETIMQVSMSKKWASKPIVNEETGEPLLTPKGKPILRKSYSVLQDDFFEHMRSAGYDDVERGERGSSEEHLTVTQFKTECEQERLAQLQEASALAQVEADQKNKEAAAAEKKAAQARAKLDDVAPLLKGIEKLAADFSDDPEQTLPEAGPLESAKSYREKKAKPLWQKIVRVLRSVYRAYFDLKSRFERLQSAYDREVSKNGSLSARIYEVCAERDGLKGQVTDYERVRRAIGPEQADRILEAAYQQEQVEKERKRGTRSKMRVGAR